MLVLYARADGRHLQAYLLPPQHCFACGHCLVSRFPLELRAVTQSVTALIGVVREQTAAARKEKAPTFMSSSQEEERNMSTTTNKEEGYPQKKTSAFSGAILMMALFSLTIFLSAGLLFLIEPMFAKFVLPSFGGTPAVWTGSMMFFQAALLSSYLYVHATTAWLGARRQALLHLAVVLLPLVLFTLAGPIDVPAEEWAPPTDENPIFWLLGLLLVAVGLPFFAVSATNPLIQRWVSETNHPSARDPYFLYRASNLGSIVGLLGYPLLMESNLRLANQGGFWTVGYGILVVLMLASAVVLWRSPPPSATTEEGGLAASDAALPSPPVATGGRAPEMGAPLSDAR